MGLIANFWNRIVLNNRQSYTKSVISMSGGSIVSPETALKVSAYYRGLIYISGQISKLPWLIKDSNNKVVENKISYLLNISPNPEMTSFMFKMAMIPKAINYGNSYAEIERNLIGEAIYLWPINEYDIQPYRDADGLFGYRVLNGGNEVWLPKEDVLHFRNIHTHDGLTGQGLTAYASEVLGIAIGADKFTNSTYANSGIPSGILSFPGTLKPDAKKRICESWKENMGGKKTGSTAVLDEGVSYSPVSISQDALQYLESRKFNVVEIARFLGVSPVKLYDTDVANYNNVEQGGLDVANDTISVWAVNLQSEVSMKLLSGKYSKFKNELNLYDLFKADMSTRGTFFTKMMQAGAITPNQIRMEEGMESYEGGDRYYIATNNFTPVDKMDELLDSQIERNKTPSNANANTADVVKTNVDQDISAELEQEAINYLRSRNK